MSERITNKQLEVMVDRVNRALGFDVPVGYGTVGAVYLYGAYGATAVHRWANEAGGASDLSGFGTKRETYRFLRGMDAALWAVRDDA